MSDVTSMKRSLIRLAMAIGLGAMLWAPAASAQAPNFSGVWLGGTPRGKFIQWIQGEPPFTAEGKARFDANKPGKGPRQAPPAFGNDPLSDANPPGLLRTLVYFRPSEFIQLPDRIIQLFEYGHSRRTIWMDGRAMPDGVGPYWYGYSVGKWEGDTLVVQTAGLDGRAWGDDFGFPISDETTVVERWRKTDANTLQMTATFTDPALFAKPWTSDPYTLKLQPKGSRNGELIETINAPIDEQEFNERIRNPAGGRDK